MNRTIENEAAAIEIMKLQAENAQLRAVNKQLREWNTGLIEAMRAGRALPDNAGEGEV